MNLQIAMVWQINMTIINIPLFICCSCSSVIKQSKKYPCWVLKPTGTAILEWQTSLLAKLPACACRHTQAAWSRRNTVNASPARRLQAPAQLNAPLVLRSLLVLDKASSAGWMVCRSSQSSLQHCVPLYWSEEVCIHGMIKYKWSEYGVTFTYELFFQVFKNFVVFVVECLPSAERCSDRTSQHYHPLQCSQEMCIRGLMCKNCPKY